jgi:hypothetical protein
MGDAHHFVVASYSPFEKDSVLLHQVFLNYKIGVLTVIRAREIRVSAKLKKQGYCTATGFYKQEQLLRLLPF